MAELKKFASVAINQFTESPYFARAEGKTKEQWERYIKPVLQGADMSCVLDLACGHGRFSEILAPLVKKLYVSDANQTCIEATQKRLSEHSHVEYVLSDGFSLDGIPDNEVTFLFCFDAMVHFDNDVVSSYLSETARIVKPGGLAFFHHSNFAERPGADHRGNPHARNFMTCELFAHQAIKRGLKVIRSQQISWGADENFVPYLDGLTVLRRP